MIFQKNVCLYYLKYCTSSHPQNLAVVLRAAIGSNVPCSEVQRRSNKSCVTEGFGMILCRKWRPTKNSVENWAGDSWQQRIRAKVPWEKKIVSKTIIEEVWYCQNLQPLSLFRKHLNMEMHASQGFKCLQQLPPRAAQLTYHFSLARNLTSVSGAYTPCRWSTLPISEL